MKILKSIAVAMLGVTLLLGGLTYLVTPAQGGGQVEELVIVSKSGEHRFEVEAVSTPVDLEMGLMFREHMDPDHGMLFQLGRTTITAFWMKNTLIPLDMIFIAPDGTIKKVHDSAVPKSLQGISSEYPVSAVLELNGGRARALGIAAGDKVLHPYFRDTKPPAISAPAK